jgi:hypothetical protein
LSEVTGRLENWWYDATNHVFWGYLYDDVKDRWRDGVHIHTSMCHAPDAKEGDVIKTRNSTYLLGKKAEYDDAE